MRNSVSAAIDRRVQSLVVAWVRRQWPVLRLVPTRWIRPAITPTATRLRRSFSRGVVALAVPSGVVVVMLTYVR
jgi:hypothetical protein